MAGAVWIGFWMLDFGYDTCHVMCVFAFSCWRIEGRGCLRLLFSSLLDSSLICAYKSQG